MRRSIPLALLVTALVPVLAIAQVPVGRTGVPADIGWHDVGDWSRLAELRTGGSGSWSAGDHVELEGTGSYVFAPGKTVVTIGLSDLVIVETDDVLLVTSRDRAEAVARMQRALDEFTIIGVTTNIPAHKKILGSDLFIAGQVTTHLIDTVGIEALAGQ